MLYNHYVTNLLAMVFTEKMIFQLVITTICCIITILQINKKQQTGQAI